MLNFSKFLKTSALATTMFALSFSHSMAALDELGSGTAATKQAQVDNSAAINVKSFAYVLTVLGIEETEQMSFGAFTPGTTEGTIDTAGDATGGVTAIQNVTNIDNAQLASVDLTGDPDEDFRLTVNGEETTIDLTHTDNVTTMTLTFTADHLSRNLAFDGSGNNTQTIGGTLAVAASQLPGLYSGTYSAAITYID